MRNYMIKGKSEDYESGQTFDSSSQALTASILGAKDAFQYRSGPKKKSDTQP